MEVIKFKEVYPIEKDLSYRTERKVFISTCIKSGTYNRRKPYTVVSHCTGDKDINKVVRSIDFNKAYEDISF